MEKTRKKINLFDGSMNDLIGAKIQIYFTEPYPIRNTHMVIFNLEKLFLVQKCRPTS